MERLRPAVAALAAAALLALLLVLRGNGSAPVRVLALPAPGANLPASPTPAASLPTGSPSAAPAAPRKSGTPVRAVTRTTPAAPAAPSPPDVRAVFAALDRARTAAFADPARGDPGAWAVPACSCYADDARRLRDLVRDGLALRGHAPVLGSVHLTRAAPTSLALLVTDRLGPYVAVDRRGRTVTRWPGSGERRWLVTLVRASGQWRIGALARAP